MPNNASTKKKLSSENVIITSTQPIGIRGNANYFWHRSLFLLPNRGKCDTISLWEPEIALIKKI
jgi:hypothetical protein